jgi:Leucine-rich repeat (LRR) protein
MKNLITILCLCLFWGSCEDKEEIYGCTDLTSCTYDPDVTIYVPSSCLEFDECGVCGGIGLDFDQDGICDDIDEFIEGCIEDCGGSCYSENIELGSWCYNIENTTELDLTSSGLTGEIPSEIGDLTNLTHLELNYNQLTGEIPSWIGDLTNLTHLNLSFNQLSGEIPKSIGNLTNLETLYLDRNDLTGEIPVEIGNLTDLTSLDLSYNDLTEEIPSEIGQLTNLTFLKLRYNDLTGLIPPEICDQGDSSPSLDNNQLCPPYPSCLSQSDVGGQDTSNCP